MNSGRIAIGLMIIIVLASMMMLRTATMPSAYAATNDNETTTATVTVNGFVSTTMFNTPIAFPNVDPNSVQTPATTQPILQIDGVTNVGVRTYVNATNFTGAGAYFAMGNLTMNVTVTGTGVANTSCDTSRCNYRAAMIFVFNETAPLGTAKNTTLAHYISVPAGQTPTSYTSNVKWCTEQIGGSFNCV
jgi:hypothetical protein